MSLNRDPFHRIRPAGQLRQEKFSLRNPFDIGNSVGWNGSNDRNDVAKVEYLLDRAGDLNLTKTDGLTGYYGARLEQAVKSYQKRNSLKVDGHLNPEGPTINSLRTQMAANEDDPADSGKDGDTPDDQTPPPDDDWGTDESPSVFEKIFTWISSQMGSKDDNNINTPPVGGTRW